MVEEKSDSEFLSYKLMLKSGKQFRAWRDKKNKCSNSRVVRKKILNETKNHNLQVKWSVPKWILSVLSRPATCIIRQPRYN